MTQYSKIALDGIFVPPATPSFAELMVQLETDTVLKPARRKDLLSGLRRIAEALHRTPAQVPADPRWLQPRLAHIAPAAIGVSTKTWQNTVSNARNAMVACGIVSKRQRRSSDLSPAWQTLWDLVRTSKDKSLLSPLPRFIFFLDRIGVAPGDVCNDHAHLYLDAVELNEISKVPRTAYKDAVMGWNRAIDRLPAWPRQRLDLSSQTRRVMLPEAEYALGFITDVDRYLEMRMRPDLLASEDGLPRSQPRPRQPIDTLCCALQATSWAPGFQPKRSRHWKPCCNRHRWKVACGACWRATAARRPLL